MRVATASTIVDTSSPESVRDLSRKERLHTWLYTLIYRLESKAAPTENEAKFVRDGKASIQIQFRSDTSSVIEKLKGAGFEITSQKGGKLTGRIPIERLAGLADIAEVKYILPVIL